MGASQHPLRPKKWAAERKTFLEETHPFWGIQLIFWAAPCILFRDPKRRTSSKSTSWSTTHFTESPPVRGFKAKQQKIERGLARPPFWMEEGEGTPTKTNHFLNLETCYVNLQDW